MDYIKSINDLQKKVENNKIESAKLSEREENLKEERKKLIDELKVYEISESGLESEIKRLEDEVSTELKKCEKLLNE